jgi:hypothetical protein
MFPFDLGGPASPNESDRVAEHWSTHHGQTDVFSPPVYWLAVPEVSRRFQFRATGGTPLHWVNYCVNFLGNRIPVERMCSLGCETGTLERHLATLKTIGSINGLSGRS